MNAGQLTELITIRHRSGGQDAAGQPSEAWADLATEWASMRGLSGLETIKAGAEASGAKASFRIRWRTGYTTAMRVLHAGVEYEIKAVSPDWQHRQHVDLVCEQARG